MVTDIVTKLRRWASEVEEAEDEDVCLTAAKEIERLREELAIWSSVFPDIAPSGVLRDRSLVEEENERLRMALDEIIQHIPRSDLAQLSDETIFSIGG